MDFLTSLKRQSFVLALCYIFIGLFFVIRPGTAAETIVRIIAVAALVLGIVKIVEFFSSQKYDKPFTNSLAGGVILSALAVFMLANPQVIVSIMYAIIGIALIVNGIVAVQSAIDLWHFETQKRMLPLIFGMITLLLGVIVLFNPFSSAQMLILISGIFMIIGGVSDLIALGYIYGVVKDREKES